MKIDIHTHILPENWPDLNKRYGYGEWPRLKVKEKDYAIVVSRGEGGELKIGKEFWDPETRIKRMDQFGINVQVLSTAAFMFNYWAKPEDTADCCRLVNDDMAEVIRKYPQRFIGLGTLPMQAPELAVEEIKRGKHDLGLAGFQIGTHINNWNLSAPELWPVFATAAEHDCPLLVHPWGTVAEGRYSQYWLHRLIGLTSETAISISSMMLGGVFERFPRLKICFSHGAGSFPYIQSRVNRGFQKKPELVAVDSQHSPSSYMGRFYADTVVYDTDSLAYLVKTVGEDKVVFGSDHPFELEEEEPGNMIDSFSGLTKSQKDKIFCKNAFEFLSLDEKLYNCESISAHKMNFHLVNNSSHETMYALEQQHWGNFCTCL